MLRLENRRKIALALSNQVSNFRCKRDSLMAILIERRGWHNRQVLHYLA